MSLEKKINGARILYAKFSFSRSIIRTRWTKVPYCKLKKIVNDENEMTESEVGLKNIIDSCKNFWKLDLKLFKNSIESIEVINLLNKLLNLFS